LIPFLFLAGLSVVLAILQLWGRRAEDPGQVRAALLRGGTAFLAGWLIQALTYKLARDASGFPLTVFYSAQAAISALLALLLWSALSSLAFYRIVRRDLFWIVPFGLLSILVGAFGRVTPFSAALLAIPALLRVRWRRELNPGTLAFVGLFGFLFVLLSVVSPRIQIGEALASHPLAGLERYSDWVRGLVSVHILAALPRLLWGMSLPIRSVRRRLFVSHVMTGLVPIALILIFWGLSTYLSVNGERARIASRFLNERGGDLGTSLETALEKTGESEVCLVNWAEIETRLRPGLRMWVSEAGQGPVTRVFGDPARGEEALAAWPDTLPHEGVVLLGGRAYLGAMRAEHGSPNPRRAFVLVPISSILGQDFQKRLDAEIFLETRWSLTALGGGRAVALAEADTLSYQDPPGRQGERRAAPGAATASALEFSNNHWQRRMVLIWARVGFFSAIRGLARNLQENPFNLFPLVFLGVVAVLFVLVEVLTLGMVSSMSGSILRALTALRQGTARLRSGNFRYRIPVEGNDELWEVAESFNEMAVDLDKARELEAEQDRIEGELALARQIQARLLPGEVPSVPQTDLAGLYVPARQVGGDYYDYIPLSRNRVGLIVADVSGKGVPAALLMSSFRAALLSQNLDDYGPARVMQRLNAFLYRSVETGRFVTAFLGVLDPQSGRVVYSNAGHNPPMLLSPDGAMNELEEGGLILGLFADTEYEQAEVQMKTGDLLTLYTDGVTEAANEDEELWGEERLLQLLRETHRAPCRRILHEVLGEVRAFSGSVGPSDDITMVVARWEGGG